MHPTLESGTQRASTEARGGSPFRRWLDQRAGIDTILEIALEEPIPGGARWAYIFGSGLLFLFVAQVLTGITLALYYVPAANDAHVTVAYIVKVVSGGAFLRSLHSYGASAMIVVLLLHIIQTFVYGAYKGKRELVWLAGCLLFLLMLGMAFTGYLLPWDQKAYFATAVGTNVMGEAPGIGNLLKQLLRGGNQMGTVTLSRFFVLHVFVLPVLIALTIVAHVYFFRKAGPAGPIDEDLAHPQLPVEPFYPRQLGKDVVFALLIAVILAALAYWFPVRLGPEANPGDTAFLPRPEWYFRPLFEWLKFWPGKSAVIGVVVVPTLIGALFVALPFLDRSLERRPLRRPFAIGIFCVILGGIVGVGELSNLQDQRDPQVATQMARQERATAAFMKAPFVPLALQNAAPRSAVAVRSTPAIIAPPVTIPGSPKVAKPPIVSQKSGRPATTTPAGAGPDATAAAVAEGKNLYATVYKCGDCHGDNGEGTDMAPKLIGVTADKITSSLIQPTPRAQDAGMPAIDQSSPDIKALVAFILSLK